MKTIETSEAQGPVLDWLVAKCVGLKPYAFVERDMGQKRPLARWCGVNVGPSGHELFSPSTDWAQGGPIIEQEEIDLGVSAPDVGGWFACMNNDTHSTEMLHYANGPTPLIAAMRCYVSSKLGETVEVPEELL